VHYLTDRYRNEKDPGMHSAARWVLLHWHRAGQDDIDQVLDAIDRARASNKPDAGWKWYVNDLGMTFSVIEDTTGRAAPSSKGKVHRFAIGATEVTLQQFREYKRHHQPASNSADAAQLPATQVTWHEAAKFCNWLSAREGVPKDQWCYEETKEGRMEFVPGYQKLGGYRLPTEEEWEFACRAGTTTPWHFGHADDELVGYYAWWRKNAILKGVEQRSAAALLKPNDFGLFDMHGNVGELCQEFAGGPKQLIANDVTLNFRGGTFAMPYSELTSSFQALFGRRWPDARVGFRVGRTMEP